MCEGNVYFNARFDDVMAIVKLEMASMLTGPLDAMALNCKMFMFQYPNDIVDVVSCGIFYG